MNFDKETIKELYKAKGHKQKDIAESLGMTPNNFSNHFNQNPIPKHLAIRILDVIGLSVEDYKEYDSKGIIEKAEARANSLSNKIQTLERLLKDFITQTSSNENLLNKYDKMNDVLSKNLESAISALDIKDMIIQDLTSKAKALENDNKKLRQQLSELRKG